MYESEKKIVLDKNENHIYVYKQLIYICNYNFFKNKSSPISLGINSNLLLSIYLLKIYIYIYKCNEKIKLKHESSCIC